MLDVDSSKGDDAAGESPAPLSDQSRFTRAKPTSRPTLQQDRRQKSSDVLWNIFCQAFGCRYSQFCEAVKARRNVWETER